MPTWIALLRGINVGGNNMLPMKDLRTLVESLGGHAVRTYLQSGNCVFRSNQTDAGRIAAGLSGAIDQRFGFRPAVRVLPPEAIRDALSGNPFPQAADDPKSLHLFFLWKPAKDPDLDALRDLAAANEKFRLTDEVLYLYAPDGIGRSKLAARIEKFVPVAMTGRNLRSVIKIVELADAIGRES